ncbi:aromatic acid exporter family protein [uncultured Friedmanniella sp.]|uniref:FUSC family protein n=1 Tax=uncultured Friedmanniella sp. TaxID=335381 RepID=UPI0035CACC53
MSEISSPVQRMKLRAFDVSERTTRLGRRSLEQRVTRLRSRSFLIVQTAVTAGLAWFLASAVFSHQQPFFAAIAAIICLGGTFGHRMRRGVELAVGVAVGIGVGDLFVSEFGTGVWQVIVVVGVSMVLASLLGAGQLMITQAAVQSIVVTIVLPGAQQGLARWLDAVVGCVIALVVATIAPSSPLRKPATLAAQMLREMASTLDAAVEALRLDDELAADRVLERARATEGQLAQLAEANSEGLAVVRHSPFRRGQLSEVQQYADLLEPLDRASRNLRVLARRSVTLVWRGQHVPVGYLELIDRVAGAARAMAVDLDEGRLPVQARDELVAAGRISAHLPLPHALSAVAILAQTRSIVVDLLELTGLDPDEARDLVPDVD